MVCEFQIEHVVHTLTNLVLYADSHHAKCLKKEFFSKVNVLISLVCLMLINERDSFQDEL